MNPQIPYSLEGFEAVLNLIALPEIKAAGLLSYGRGVRMKQDKMYAIAQEIIKCQMHAEYCKMRLWVSGGPSTKVDYGRSTPGPVSYCSAAKSCLTLCDHMYFSTPGFPVLH